MFIIGFKKIYVNNVFIYVVNDLYEQYIMVNIVEYMQLLMISYIVSNVRIMCVQYFEYLKVIDVNIMLYGGLYDQLILFEVEIQNCLSEYYVNSN